ncbi:hypothetical protein Bhyg_01818 [Pseudolycoriella hygida]|uniref:Uncharacterized protein n=1 Tax=Pseudolycoriella hygida TaxID=35572 RepID=A0A9Q0NA83_9DIPT|nr:hypothetical protein Bhyg_01818 [Pseudolycoriella hygida]
MSIRMRVVGSLSQGLNPYHRPIFCQLIIGKHTSSLSNEVDENKHQQKKDNTNESCKLATVSNQTLSEIEVIKLESKLLKEMLLTKEALIHSKDALIHSKDELIHSKEINLERELVIRSFLEAELLAVKHKLHCRGVIERFEILRSSAFINQPKMTRSATWNKILNNDMDLQNSLSELKGFPSPVSSSERNTVIAKLVTQFYRRLSDDIHRDPSGQIMCIINKNFCSDWEMGFMVEICKSIPVRYRVENADH